MPEPLKSQAKSSTGGGSDQYESGDVQETSTVNTMRAGARRVRSIYFNRRTEPGSLVISQNALKAKTVNAALMFLPPSTYSGETL